MTDQEIVPLLQTLGRATFFTRDLDFYKRALCHSGYCLVYVAAGQAEVAALARRLLRHPLFDTWARRRGNVIRVSRAGIRVWRLHAPIEQVVGWQS